MLFFICVEVSHFFVKYICILENLRHPQQKFNLVSFLAIYVCIMENLRHHIITNLNTTIPHFVAYNI